MNFPHEPIGPPIVPGMLYRYTAAYPPGCCGGLYRVVSTVTDVPSYQEKVLLHCIEGKDRGLWFICSPWNFAFRYEMVDLPTVVQPPAPAPPPVALPVKVADWTSKGKF